MQELLGVLLLLEFEHVPDLHEFENVAEAREVKDGLYSVVKPLDIDVSALLLCILQNA